MTVFPEKTYSFVEAAYQLPYSYRKLYDWYHDGKLDFILGHKQRPRLTKPELIKLQELTKQPRNTMTLQQLQQTLNISDVTLHKILAIYHIKPDGKHRPNKVGPKYDYYTEPTVTKIKKAILKHYQSHNKTLNLQPNTTHQYNKNIDLNQADLCRLLGYGINNNKLIFQWIQYHRINGNYSIDPNGKLFFTPQQARYIKNHFGTIPPDTYGSNRDLAKALHIYANQVTNFRKYYELPAYKVLGHKEVYYSNKTAQKFIDWYQNPSHRPYPYHPMSKHYQKPQITTCDDLTPGLLYINDTGSGPKR